MQALIPALAAFLSSLAYAEMSIVLSVLFRRFEFELYETSRERDIDLSRDCFVGKSMKESPGMRVKIVART